MSDDSDATLTGISATVALSLPQEISVDKKSSMRFYKRHDSTPTTHRTNNKNLITFVKSPFVLIKFTTVPL